MSCNIYDAWRFKETASVKDAVALVQQVSGIQKEAVKEEIIRVFDGVCWMPWYDYIVEAFEGISAHLGRIVAAAIFPVMESHCLSPIWTFPAARLDELEASLKKHTASLSLANRENTLFGLEDFCKDLYGEFMKRDGSLLFLTDKEGNAYLKGQCLTAAASRYLDARLIPFGYTDSTEMQEWDFPEYAEKFASCESEEARAELLAEAQSARGKKWDEILCGQTNWKGLGLTYSLNDMSKAAKWPEIIAVVKGILENHKKA